jgi:Zn ribbon nucleic-acid-binding protein
MAKNRNHSERSQYMWREDKTVVKDLCFECGSNQDIHYHHVVPESKGGTMTLPLCILCHGKVHNRDFLKIKELQRIGIERAKERGVYSGRRKGAKSDMDVWAKKPKISKAIEYLNQGYKAREISKIVNIHVNTITKIKEYLRTKEIPLP